MIGQLLQSLIGLQLRRSNMFGSSARKVALYVGVALIALALTGCDRTPPPAPTPEPGIGGGPPETTLLRPPSDCPILDTYRITRPGLLLGPEGAGVELPEGCGVALPRLAKPGYEALVSTGYLVPEDWTIPHQAASD
jgi:hypothetical protein